MKGAEPHFYLNTINITNNSPIPFLYASYMRELSLLLLIRDVNIPTNFWLNYVVYAILSGFRDDLLQATYDSG
jgi:hypothetical protein